jgi:hypothetical protein
VSKLIAPPFGRVSRKITIEIDDKGQTRIDAQNVTTAILALGKPVPMNALELASIFSQLASANIQILMQGQAQAQKPAPENGLKD